jgi:hypothetical protein
MVVLVVVMIKMIVMHNGGHDYANDDEDNN